MVGNMRNRRVIEIAAFLLLAAVGVIFILWAAERLNRTGTAGRTPSADWVAIVGSDTITAAEYRFRFETSPIVGQGLPARVDFLKALIAERLLARNAGAVHLDTLRENRVLLRQVREEAEVEELLRREVDRRIRITDAEMRRDFLKLVRTLTLDAWVFPDSAQAFAAAARARAGVPFDSLAVSSLSKGGPLFLSQQELQYGQAEPAFEDTAFGLGLGEVGGPVHAEGRWWLLRLVRFEQSRIPSEAAFASYAPRLKSVILRRMRGPEQKRYLGEIMRGRRMEVDPAGFRWLVGYLRSVLPAGPDSRELAPPLSIEPVEALDPVRVRGEARKALDLPLLKIEGPEEWTWSRRDALEHLYSMPRSLLRKEGEAFDREVYQALVWLAEFEALVREAERRGLGEDPVVRGNAAMWSAHVLALSRWSEELERIAEGLPGDTLNAFRLVTRPETDSLMLGRLDELARGAGVRVNLPRLQALKLHPLPVLLRKTHFPNRPATPYPVGYRWALEWDLPTAGSEASKPDSSSGG